jgi:ribosomal protein S18 acetylase RimI-like enzyme
MHIRPIREADHRAVIGVVDEWWGGRPMAALLPRLFSAHFQDTSFAVEDDGRLVGFLIGFVSQSRPKQAYIHFVRVHPEYRKRGLGGQLHQLFFDAVGGRGCDTVCCITSPVNKGSIAFHRRMGFQVEPGDAEVDGVPVASDYDGSGKDRVRFIKRLS